MASSSFGACHRHRASSRGGRDVLVAFLLAAGLLLCSCLSIAFLDDVSPASADELERKESSFKVLGVYDDATLDKDKSILDSEPVETLTIPADGKSHYFYVLSSFVYYSSKTGKISMSSSVDGNNAAQGINYNVSATLGKSVVGTTCSDAVISEDKLPKLKCCTGTNTNLGTSDGDPKFGCDANPLVDGKAQVLFEAGSYELNDSLSAVTEVATNGNYRISGKYFVPMKFEVSASNAGTYTIPLIFDKSSFAECG